MLISYLVRQLWLAAPLLLLLLGRNDMVGNKVAGCCLVGRQLPRAS
jgi:hypothetical protein